VEGLQPSVLLQLEHHVPQQHEDVLVLLKPTEQLLAALCVRLPQQEVLLGPLAADSSHVAGKADSQSMRQPAAAAAALQAATKQHPNWANSEQQGTRLLLNAMQQQTFRAAAAATPCRSGLKVETAQAVSSEALVDQLVHAATSQHAQNRGPLCVTSIDVTPADLLSGMLL
jgi:hypothetical protein